MSSADHQKYLSWHNTVAGVGSGKRRLLIHDVTLRDGEQQAGIVFSRQEKIEIALSLDQLGVDRIEAGRVDVGEEEIEALRALASLGLNAEIWAVTRALVSDIRTAADVGVDGVGIVTALSERHLSRSNIQPEDAIRNALAAAAEARACGVKATLLVADGSRLPAETLRKVLMAASASGLIDGIALMDSYGVLTPQGTTNLVTLSRGYSDLPIEIHAHNDFGLAVANALAAAEAGASVVHASMLGLGERVGNTALEEFAIAAAVLYGFEHNLRLENITKVADLVQLISGVTVACNKPVIGDSYRKIESSFVAAEYIKLLRSNEDIRFMFPVNPDIYGGKNIEIVIGKYSGIANIEHVLTAENISLDKSGQEELLRAAQREAVRRHRALETSEIRALVAELAARRLGWVE
jgi:isopropylmalate/homocitrate/citramalate synthase